MVEYEKEVGQLRTVTKVAKQKKSSKRFNVYLDDEYAFSISEDIYVKFHVHKGKQLSEEEIAEIQYEDSLHRAYTIAIQYLSYRMRTEREVRIHLQQKDVHPEAVEKVISRLYNEKLLDDWQFATAFVKDRMNRSTKGPLVIARELKEKGVSEVQIHEALTQYTIEKQKESALKWLEKEVKKKTNKPHKKLINLLLTKLLQRGFSKEIAKDVINVINFEKDEDEEFLLLKKQADKLYTKYKNKYEGYELEMQLKQRLFARGFEMHQIDSYVSNLVNEETN